MPRYIVRISRTTVDSAMLNIEAKDEKEAWAIAEEMDEINIDWDYGDPEMEVWDVKENKE